MKLLIPSLFAFSLTFSTFGQMADRLTLVRPERIRPINTLSFSLPPSKVNRLHDAKGEKLVLNVPFIVVNGDTAKVKHARVRGTSSSYLRRKSLNIKLGKSIRFGIPPDTFSLDKFYAVSLNMDRNYIRNRISYSALSYLNVPVPDNCYTNVLINGLSEGVYMIYNPPEQFAIARKGAKVVIRRGYNETIDGWNYAATPSKEAASLKKKFQSIYTEILPNHQGEALYQKLQQVLDLDEYFKWLAFNHLFQNGDYSDELYLMWSDSKSRFEIIPWDFDDLLQPQPHEGFEKRNAILGDKLIYSSEDALDIAIANDQFVYKKYLLQYQQLLEILSPVVLSEILNAVYQDVYPFFQQQDIINQSQFDRGGITDRGKLESDVQDIYAFIRARIAIYRNKISGELQ